MKLRDFFFFLLFIFWKSLICEIEDKNYNIYTKLHFQPFKNKIIHANLNLVQLVKANIFNQNVGDSNLQFPCYCIKKNLETQNFDVSFL